MRSRLREHLQSKGLTKSEIEIVEAMFFQNKGSQQIAKERFVSHNCIKTHKWMVFKKLNISTQRSLIMYCLMFLYPSLFIEIKQDNPKDIVAHKNGKEYFIKEYFIETTLPKGINL